MNKLNEEFAKGVPDWFKAWISLGVEMDELYSEPNLTVMVPPNPRDTFKELGVRVDKVKFIDTPTPDKVSSKYFKDPYVPIYFLKIPRLSDPSEFVATIAFKDESALFSEAFDIVINDIVTYPGKPYHTKWLPKGFLNEHAIGFAVMDASDMENYELGNRLATREANRNDNEFWKPVAANTRYKDMNHQVPVGKRYYPSDNDTLDKSGYSPEANIAARAEKLKELNKQNYKTLNTKVEKYLDEINKVLDDDSILDKMSLKSLIKNDDFAQFITKYKDYKRECTEAKENLGYILADLDRFSDYINNAEDTLSLNYAGDTVEAALSKIILDKYSEAKNIMKKLNASKAKISGFNISNVEEKPSNNVFRGKLGEAFVVEEKKRRLNRQELDKVEKVGEATDGDVDVMLAAMDVLTQESLDIDYYRNNLVYEAQQRFSTLIDNNLDEEVIKYKNDNHITDEGLCDMLNRFPELLPESWGLTEGVMTSYNVRNENELNEVAYMMDADCKKDFIKFMKRWQEMIDEYYVTHYQNLDVPDLLIYPGQKFLKIVSKGSVMAFIDKHGNVYKAASWNSPAKGVRYYVQEYDTIHFDPYTSFLYGNRNLTPRQ